MSPRTVNVGIIGGGLMGREVAAALARWPALVDHPVRPRLTGVCDVNPAALAYFDQIDTVTTRVTDHRDLLADDRIDVVYIAVRHDLHERLYVDAVRAGKALLAEKPFGIDAAAADAISTAIAGAPGAFVRCSSEFPFFPGAQWAFAHVRSGALGQIVEARSAFLHSSDIDPRKPLNWKRQNRFCGEAGVMNDLGLHVWHLPLRLGWAPRAVHATLQNIIPQRPGPSGDLEPCETWDNATVHATTAAGFPLVAEMKRIAPGQKNTWVFEATGLDGGVRFSTANPKAVEVFGVVDLPGIGREQTWQRVDASSQSAWPTVTGPIFETGFSDSILQMWASFLAEREGLLGERFGCATPEEARTAHAVAAAAGRSHEQRTVVDL